jgi:glycogen operon protein
MVMSADEWQKAQGAPAPLGVSWLEAEQAYNFALYSRNATAVSLLLYSDADFVTPLRTVPFNFPDNKTGRIWHRRIAADILGEAKYYAYRVEGPFAPAQGDRFDPDKILLDPYACGVFFPPGYSKDAAMRAGSNAGRAPLGVLPERAVSAAVSGELPRHGHDLIIYELHVRGFTRRANSNVPENERGTFAGIIAKIPYLQALGITAVELLPVHQFEPAAGNYWGYMTLNFFSPHAQYASDGTAAGAKSEFRSMIEQLHAAGFEVFLDVVYNHTAEMGAGGPTYSFRGLDNSTYYALSPFDLSNYMNYSGCGNDLRTTHPAVRRLVVDSLRVWTQHFGVDGFRFDLASIFARNDNGTLNLEDPPIISEISSDPLLDDARLIAEPWDAGDGGYLMGRAFPGTTWRQWNDHFRDTVRGFLKSDAGLVPDLMTRLYGSTDLFSDAKIDAYRRFQSINYVDCHDGLNLYDLVSYTNDGQRSWNCGYEGDAGVPADVAALRRKQVKNFCSLLMIANGTPMFVAGDEFLNTQHGNANPYDQDNEITWLDWALADSNGDVVRFFRLMIAFRKAHPSLGRSIGWGADVIWYGTRGGPDLSPSSRSLAFHLRGAALNDVDIYAMINAYWQPLTFDLPAPGTWRRIVDTSLASPDDIVAEGTAQPVAGAPYPLPGRSIAVLIRAV